MKASALPLIYVLVAEPTLEATVTRALRSDSWTVVTTIKDETPALVVCDSALLSQTQNWKAQGTFTVALLPDNEPETLRQALNGGADDYAPLPVEAGALLLRVRHTLELRRLNIAAREAGTRVYELESLLFDLNGRLDSCRVEAERAQLHILDRLADAVDYREKRESHTQRIGELAARLAERIGLEPEQVALIREAAPLHDVGKIGVPANVLIKPGQLDDKEWEQIKTHPVVGADLLGTSDSKLLQTAQSMALNHHERWDARGYPRGLGGTEIPIEGRILAVVDTYDALTSQRPHKAAWSSDEAIAEIERCAGRQFDPEIVQAFVALMREN